MASWATGQSDVKMTREEYLRYERACIGDKHEFVDGEVFAMSGGTRKHSLLGGNVLRELGTALLDRPCEVHGSDMRVAAADGSYHYPDVSIVCEQPRFEDQTEDVLENPSVIIEVRSDSTERYDRGDKFAHYRTIPTLRDYVLVSQTTVRIEHFHRAVEGAEWTYRVLGPSDALVLEDPACAIPVASVYRRVFPEP